MTGADFYIGRGPSATWVGSLSHNARPSILHWTTVGEELLNATTERDYAHALDALLSLPVKERRNWAYRPSSGWPWCWPDSSLTGWCYAFDGGRVWVSYFGRAWFPCPTPEQMESGPVLKRLRRKSIDGPQPVFPVVDQARACAEQLGKGPRTLGFWELLGLIEHAARVTGDLEVTVDTDEEATRLFRGDHTDSLLGAVLLTLGVPAAEVHALGLNRKPPSVVFPRFGFPLTPDAAALADDFQVYETRGTPWADLLTEFEETADPYDPNVNPLTAPLPHH